MGQQQLLLIVLGVIIVGIAVVAGISMFTSGAAQANLEGVISDMTNFRSNAQGWFRKPVSLGGGGRDFTDVTLAAFGAPSSTDNGVYSISGTPTATSFVLQGVGTEDGDDDGTNVTVMMTIYGDSVVTDITNR